MGGALAVGGGAVVSGCCVCPPTSASSPCAGRVRFKFGIARYTFWKIELEKALGIMKEIDCHYLGL